MRLRLDSSKTIARYERWGYPKKCNGRGGDMVFLFILRTGCNSLICFCFGPKISSISYRNTMSSET